MPCTRCTPDQKCGSHVGFPRTAEHRAAMSAKIGEASRKRWAAMSDEEKHRIIDAGLKFYERQPTEPEVIALAQLRARGFEPQVQVPLHGYVVDFMVNGIVIEVFGCYWHCCTSCGFTDRDEIRKRDERKVAALKRNGFDVIIVWEHELVSDEWLDAEEIP